MEKKKISTRAAVCAFCIAAASNFGFSIVYAYTQYYVGFQNATGFTNTQLGLLLSVLGVASTILYLPGGFIADKFDPIKLTTIGLIGAGAVGFLIAQFPSYPIMLALYVIWPVFAILIAWNPQIKVLRLISEDDEQAKIQTIRAYGRTVLLLIISFVGSGMLARMDDARALKITLYLYGGLAIICAIIAAIAYKPVESQLAAAKEKSVNLKEYGQVLKMPEVWAIGLIGFCTYIASTGVTYLQPYFAEVYGFSSSTSSIYAIIAKNIALISAPIMTWIAVKKKLPVTRVLGLSLIIASICFIAFILFPKENSLLIIAIFLYMLAAMCIMATWAMQFTPVSEVKIPMSVTGSAIGVISMFSFISDIFYSAICGHFIDSYAFNGYKWIFGMTAVLLIIGALSASYLVKKIKARQSL